jgi:hypothetical protein
VNRVRKRLILVLLSPLLVMGCLLSDLAKKVDSPVAMPPTLSPTPSLSFGLTLPAQPLSPTAPHTVAVVDTVTPIPSATPVISCLVYTGLEGGHLTLRGGPGTQYPALDWLDEGQAITLTQPITGTWVHLPGGWANSHLLECGTEK